MSLPISVVIPHMEEREDFFLSYTLPSIERNEPREIITEGGTDGAQAKRNRGADRATSEFLFFCDDDIILANDTLSKLYENIGNHSFAYCDYLAANHPTKGFLKHTAKEFDLKTLKMGNYIDTNSLLRKADFPGFDEDIVRLQDWDLWLTITEQGGTGIYVKDTNFIAYYLDNGITSESDQRIGGEARRAVMRKHGLK